MRKYYVIVTLLVFSTLVSCEDDNDLLYSAPQPDLVQPIVQINLPSTEPDYLIIGGIELIVILMDDRGLDNVKVYLTDPIGITRQIFVSKMENSNVKLREYSIGIPLSNELGQYSVTVEADDQSQNKRQESVKFNIHAPDLNIHAFIKAFDPGIIKNVDWSWFGVDFKSWEEIDEGWINYLFYLMVNTNLNAEDQGWVSEAEWENFTDDFDIKNQTWATWDTDANGKLGEDEFDDAFTKLKFFEQWDMNKDGFMSKEEFATGIFDRWDRNKDNILNQEEYRERYYYYLVRNS